MMEYILKIKNLADNLAAIGEPIIKRDQILQLLGGLRANYNSIVASLTTYKCNNPHPTMYILSALGLNGPSQL